MLTSRLTQKKKDCPIMKFPTRPVMVSLSASMI
jgi:hypothetical protein